MKSVLGKNWKKQPINEEFAFNVTRSFQISDVLARLVARNVNSIDEAENFLYPKIKSLLPDPFHLKDMKQGVERVIQAINNKETICIFADYDVDGATSSAILKNFFDDITVSSFIYVPDRIAEGYGPNAEAMQRIKNRGASLIITVDCGSVAFEAIEHAVDIGLEVIVIDHHLSLDELPKAVALINPNRLDEDSDCKNLAAVGVSFLFLVALLKSLKELNFFENKHAPNLMSYLDLVALGTVCDVMQITGLNRAFVMQGLKVAKQRGNIGYRALCDVASIESAPDCYHLGFILGPRINAGGRVGKSDLGATLLSTKSPDIATRIAKELDIYNEERKAIEFAMLEEASAIAEKQKDSAILFIAGEGWHPGVIGIVAGRLKEKYNKPTAIIAVNEGVGKASCRSVKGVDFGCKIIEAKQRGLLIAGGGHAMAAGFTVDESEMEKLHEFLEEQCARQLAVSDAHLTSYYDIDITTSAASVGLVKEISALEPYGVGNPAPIFRFSGLYVLKADIVGLKHIKILFAPDRMSYGKKTLPAIIFNAVDTPISDVIFSKKPLKLDVFGKLKINSWQGNETVQLILEDVCI
ncbi:MAG: hypothetical protein DGJ47_000803 [Rickettsiaceae bacterium]